MSMSIPHRKMVKRGNAAIESLEQRQLLTAVVFTVNSALSALTVGGVIQTASGNIDLTAQAAGSLTTSYSGTIDADVEAGSIQFNSSSVTAANNGTWEPDSTPGNYGAFADAPSDTIPLAIRGLAAEGSSPVLTLGAGGAFSSMGESLSITGGEVDYTLEGDTARSLVGLTANNTTTTNGTYIVSGGQATVTIPFAVTYTTTVFTANDTQLTLNGDIVATAPAPVLAASISGTVYAPSVFPIETIYIDTNNNGVLDVGEPSTTIGTNGNYTFSGLSAGNKIIRQIVPAGFKQTSPGNGYGIHLNLAAGQMLANNNFTDAVAPGSISGTVRGPGSVGLAAVTVYLDENNNGKLDAGEPQTTTSAAGGYMLNNLAAKPYIVRQILPAGYSQITPGNGFGVHATLISGQSVTNANFSDAPITAPTGTISGEVFVDANGNGILDPGETGLSDCTLYIDLNNSHDLLAGDPTATTDANGDFAFTGLAAGNYIVRTTEPSGWLQTVPTNNFGRHITLSSGQFVGDVLFGELSDD